MFFIPKTVVLALVFQFFRACGAHFLPELFFANAIQFVRSVLYNINSAVATRKPNVIKSQRADRSAKKRLRMRRERRSRTFIQYDQVSARKPHCKTCFMHV